MNKISSVRLVLVIIIIILFFGATIFLLKMYYNKITHPIIDGPPIITGIEESPTEDKPIVGISSRALTLLTNEKTELHIKWNNTNSIPAIDATVIIDSCTLGNHTPIISYEKIGEYPLSVTTTTLTVEPNAVVEFPLTIENFNLNQGTYICKLEIIQESDPTVIYESLTFFLRIEQ